MSKSRIYGNENTHLVLTAKAFEAYSCTTPLAIAEYEQEDGSYLYSMRGAFEADDLTDVDVNELLEQTYYVPWDTIVGMMDDEIREQVHAELAPCTDEEFYARYCELHEQKYGEEFEIN